MTNPLGRIESHPSEADTFISTLGLSPILIKSHPNYQDLQSYGVIAA